MPRVDRRMRPRADVHWRIRVFHHEFGTIDAETENVSAEDMLFVSSTTLPIGESVQVELTFNSGETVHCHARIVRSEPASRRRTAYAAALWYVSDNDRETFQRNLDELYADNTLRAAA